MTAATLTVAVDWPVETERLVLRPATLDDLGAAQAVQADLGWTLHPDHTGRGFATEALEAALRICFDELGLRRVTADCFAVNERSWRLMERIGMRRETHSVRDSLHRSGAWLDGFGYALLADEWRAAVAARAGTNARDDGDA